MSLDIVPYSSDHIQGVEAFNRRLAASGSRWRFPETPTAPWVPNENDAPVWQDLFVAIEGDVVHGTYMIKAQSFLLHGEPVQAASLQLPISEGIIDKRYALVGPRLLRNAVRRHPYLFGLGMGSTDTPLAQLYRIHHFQFTTCSFLFRVVHPNRFLREIAFLRSTPWRRRALDVLTISGAGWLALKAVDGARKVRSSRARNASVDEVGAFGNGIDEVWDGAHAGYSLIAVRTSDVVNRLFPPGDDRFLRIEVRHAGRLVGWAVVADTAMAGHRQFGNMRVGSIIDQLALPGHEQTVVAAGERLLADRGVDLIVSNQLSERWERAFVEQGFLRGPSNFHFAASPALAEKLTPFASSARQIHMTRGDGDGPVHLVPGFALSDPDDPHLEAQARRAERGPSAPSD